MDTQTSNATQSVPESPVEKVGENSTNQTSSAQTDNQIIRNTPFSKIMLVLILCIIIGVLIVVRYAYIKNSTSHEATTITPSQGDLPKVIQPVATSSAFISIEQDISSLSDRFSSVIIRDESLIPPILELPLGFSTK
jgi:hypothetical protein